MASSSEDHDSSLNKNDEQNAVKKPLLDQLNMADTGYEKLREDQAPADKFFIVYGVVLLFGIATLLPWNIFITATDYFVNYKLNTNESMSAWYRNDFTFYVGIVGQTTNVLMNLINICISFGGNPKNRIPYTFGLCSLVVLFHVGLAIVNSSEWPFTFFVLCCASVFIMYIATGIMNSCVYYVASIFPMEYVNAIVLGNNLAGIFTTMMSIASKATSPNLRIAAIYYFLASFVVLCLGFTGYFVMHYTQFYRFYSQLAEQNMKKSLVSNQSSSKPRIPYFKIIRQIWLLLFCIWLNFFSTLAIFPVYQLGVERASEKFFIANFWYHDVVTFLTFNVFVTLGNMLPKLVRKPGPKWIPVPVIARAILVFIFFAFCNFKPNQRAESYIPVLIKNDYVYWSMCILSPLSFGYFTSLMMMYTPKQVAPEHSGYASMIAALLITIGVTTGLQFTKIFEFIVLT